MLQLFFLCLVKLLKHSCCEVCSLLVSPPFEAFLLLGL